MTELGTTPRVLAIADQEPMTTLEEIGQRVGVTRERVRQIMAEHRPGVRPQDVRREWRHARLRAFVAEHPEALTIARVGHGGMSWVDLAAALGVAVRTVQYDWRTSGLPARIDPLAGLSSEEANKRREWRVLRTETCIACGKQFPWLVQDERNLTRGIQKNIVCGQRCGIAASPKRAQWGKWRRGRRGAGGDQGGTQVRESGM